MAAAGGGGKTTTSRIRWLIYLARGVVGTLVTLVAVAVIVRAVVVMLRPEKLQMKLAGGFVHVARISSMPPPGNEVRLSFVLHVNNPSGRASVTYRNVTVRLIDGGGSPAPPMIADFPLPYQIPVPRQIEHDAYVGVGLTLGEDVPPWYVREWFEDRSVGGAVMEVSSLLTSYSYLAKNEPVSTRSAVATTYHCWPVTIAVGDGEGNTTSSSSDYGSVDTPCYDNDE